MQREETPATAVAQPVANSARVGNHASRREEPPPSSTTGTPLAAGKPGNGPATNSPFFGGNGELILVVDDEPCVRLVAAQILTKAGFRVLVAENGVEGIALHRIHRDRLALVISDMIMPVMDGPRMVEVLRRNDPALRIIVASGSNTEADRAKFRVHGVNRFLAKPYTALELINMVKTGLRAPAAEAEAGADSRAGRERAMNAA